MSVRNKQISNQINQKFGGLPSDSGGLATLRDDGDQLLISPTSNTPATMWRARPFVKGNRRVEHLITTGSLAWLRL